MSKQRKKPATLRMDAEYRAVHRMDAEFLSEQMAAVATMMWATAERMESLSQFNHDLGWKSMELAAASRMISEWASELREQANKNGGGK